MTKKLSSLLGREALEACIDLAYGVYTRSEILGGSVELERESDDQPELGDRVALLVKSTFEASIDEVPILNSISEALGSQSVSLEIHEYDKLVDSKGSRYERFSKSLEEVVGKRKALIAILPYVMPLALLSKLNKEAVEILEERSSVIVVNVRYKNLLYLPDTDIAKGFVELVGKENSLSSTERLQWLKEEALRRGFKRVELKTLPDNKSVFDYVTALGPRGIYKRVPVTKLSYFIVAFARCQGLSGLEEFLREEEAVHAIYIYGLKKELVEALLSKLRTNLSKPSLPILREPHRTWIKKGVERVMIEIHRVYGLMEG